MLLIVTTDAAVASAHAEAEFVSGRVAAVSSYLFTFGYRVMHVDDLDQGPGRSVKNEGGERESF